MKIWKMLFLILFYSCRVLCMEIQADQIFAGSETGLLVCESRGADKYACDSCGGCFLCGLYDCNDLFYTALSDCQHGNQLQVQESKNEKTSFDKADESKIKAAVKKHMSKKGVAAKLFGVKLLATKKRQSKKTGSGSTRRKRKNQ